MSYDIRCNACNKWTPEDQWEDTEVECELCRTHEAIRCPQCRAVFDEVLIDLERRGL